VNIHEDTGKERDQNNINVLFSGETNKQILKTHGLGSTKDCLTEQLAASPVTTIAYSCLLVLCELLATQKRYQLQINRRN
jgi:hypothetical protein